MSRTVFVTSQYCMDSVRKQTRSFGHARPYVTPNEAATERAYNLTARRWQSWMNKLTEIHNAKQRMPLILPLRPREPVDRLGSLTAVDQLHRFCQ
jgi:hypothetical protein